MGSTPAYQRFFAELKRRKVFRVAAAYGAGAFVVIQAADVIFPRIPFPEWTISFVVWLCLLGFPIAVFLAWAFERTDEGVRRTEDAPDAEIEDIIAQPASRRWPSGIAALLGIGLLAAGAWAAWQVAAPTAVEVAEARLAVFPFGVTASSSELDWLNEGLPTILSQNLFEAGQTETVDPVRTIKAAGKESGAGLDVASAGRVSRGLGAGQFVVGSVQGAGGRVRINAALYALRDSIHSLARGEVEGDTTELFLLVDRLTGQLLGGRNEFGAANVELVRTAAHTTDSLPALRAYLEGEQDLRNGDLDEARESFVRAAAIDSTFALAMYRNAFVHLLDGDEEEATEWAERASRFPDRLAPYDRDALAAFRSHLEGEIRVAERRYRELKQTYPSRLDTRVLLTLLLNAYDPMRGRPLDEAEELFAELREADPGYLCIACLGLSILEKQGEYVEAVEHSLEMTRLEPDSIERAENLPRDEAALALVTRDSAAWAAARRDLLPNLENGENWLVWLALETGQPALADTLLRVDFAADSLPWLRQHADFARGRWTRAYERIAEVETRGMSQVTGRATWMPLDAALPAPILEREIAYVKGRDSAYATGMWAEIFPHRRLYALALLHLQAGDASAALAYADSMASLPADPSFAPLTRNLTRIIRGEAALRAGDVDEARAELDAFEWEMSAAANHSLRHLGMDRGHLLRAEAAWRDGDVDEAHRWLEYGMAASDDRSLLELRRGQIQEARGNFEQARIHYARVVEALEPADPELVPRREEARAALSAILESGG